MESGLWESYYPLICAASNREMWPCSNKVAELARGMITRFETR
jgi:hypothetical protein